LTPKARDSSELVISGVGMSLLKGLSTAMRTMKKRSHELNVTVDQITKDKLTRAILDLERVE